MTAPSSPSLPATVIDVFDESALEQKVKEDVYRYGSQCIESIIYRRFQEQYFYVKIRALIGTDAKPATESTCQALQTNRNFESMLYL